MYINHSRAKLFNQCKRKFALTHVINGGLVPERQDDRFAIGIAVHYGLEQMALNAYDPPGRAKSFYLTERSKNWNGVLLDEWLESADLIYRMVKHYINTKFRKLPYSIIGTERVVSVPLGEICYSCGEPYKDNCSDTLCSACDVPIHYWVGIIDLLINQVFHDEDHIAVVDYKTTASTPGDDFLNNFRQSFQLLGYVYAAAKDSGLEIKRYGVQALQKAKTIGTDASIVKTCGTCRNGKKKVLTCITCNKTGKVEKKVVLEPFRDKFFTVDDSDIDRFALWALRMVHDIEREAELFKTEPESAYPMNDALCNFGCEFKEICWSNRNALEWYNPPEELKAGLVPKPKDYVTKIAKEESG